MATFGLALGVPTRVETVTIPYRTAFSQSVVFAANEYGYFYFVGNSGGNAGGITASLNQGTPATAVIFDGDTASTLVTGSGDGNTVSTTSEAKMVAPGDQIDINANSGTGNDGGKFVFVIFNTP